MIEIKKEIKRVVIDTHITYEAFDGTKFKDEEECKKYENTALCVVKAKIKRLIATPEFNAWEVMGGYEDNVAFGVKVSSEEDADTIKQWLLLEYSYLQKEECDKSRKDQFAKIDSAIGDILIIGVNCDDEWYIINSRKNLINNLTNLDKKDNA